MTDTIEIDGLRKRYGDRVAVHELDLRVRAGLRGIHAPDDAEHPDDVDDGQCPPAGEKTRGKPRAN